MGDPIDKFNCEEGSKTSWYICDTLPRSHPEAEFYLLQAMPKTGVCFVKAVGDEKGTNVYGDGLRRETDRIQAQVEKKYGTGYGKTGFLVSGSIWDKPRY